YGRLLNIAGSERYIGAALLSTKAAVKAGAGLVTLAAPDFVVSSVAHAVPEAVFTRNDIESVEKELENVSAISVGCGIGATEESRLMTEYVIRNAPCPIILDADGINSISDNINVLQENKYELSYREEEKEDVSDNSENAENGDNVENSESELSVTPKVILTPHPAEFARLTGLTVEEIQSNRIDYAKIFAKESSAIVVLKGVNTVIASPCGKVYVNSTGNAGLAKAGTGDVLTGIIASLTAQGIGLFEASVLGVYLHGLAADELAKTSSLSSITASEIINYI
ncbi:MAG: NAD(P)H-hydrate dehydratase, partial [Oscillospiraceae bacterium]|nr:NAD(P)H-hydrate dehydratase [Oscillospiraceae bacterium]